MAAPRAGQRGTYRDTGFTVVRVEGNMCWAKYDSAPDDTDQFIWRFREGMNTMHDWPGKNGETGND